MKILPIAFDSLGTRSMATYVETEDVKILLDPGVSLAPTRYGLSPHPIEIERMNTHWSEIKKYAEMSDVLAVTHYHYDHHDPNEPEIYRDKIALIKHPTQNINYSQKKRAKYFLDQIEGLPKTLEYSDGREFTFGDTQIRFSAPVFHGTSSKLGYVTEVSIVEGEDRFLFTSDVEGPSIDEQTNFIIQENPRTIFLDGPMTYMLGFRYSKLSLEKSVENMTKIINETIVKDFVVDHHFLRDLEWKKRIENVFEAAEDQDVRILTAAEFLGQENDLLEARRKELYQKQ
ncbi:MAG: hypothetical protein ACE5K4_02790 [Candidatus Hydrothermarchaeota archaeon]